MYLAGLIEIGYTSFILAGNHYCLDGYWSCTIRTRFRVDLDGVKYIERVFVYEIAIRLSFRA